MQDPTLAKEASGYWDCIHRLSADPDAEMLALSLIHWLKDNFFCPVCRKHMALFMETYHPNSCIGRRIILQGQSVPKIFEWGVQLHNNVNRNKKSRIYTIEEAYERYRKKAEDEPCTLSCMNAVGPTVEEVPRTPILRIVRK